jgi:hypothetical protein
MGEWLFELTEKLRETQLVEFSLWVSDWPFALWLQSNFLAIPGFQTLHIIAIAALFSAVLMLNLRVWGLTGRDQPVEAAYHRYRPWVWVAVAALGATGVILLISEPVRNMVNPIFWIKMVFLSLAVAATLAFQTSVRRRMEDWEVSPAGHGALRAGGLAVTLLWCAVITGGRWIAYAPV